MRQHVRNANATKGNGTNITESPWGTSLVLKHPKRGS